MPGMPAMVIAERVGWSGSITCFATMSDGSDLTIGRSTSQIADVVAWGCSAVRRVVPAEEDRPRGRKQLKVDRAAMLPLPPVPPA